MSLIVLFSRVPHVKTNGRAGKTEGDMSEKNSINIQSIIRASVSIGVIGTFVLAFLFGVCYIGSQLREKEYYVEDDITIKLSDGRAFYLYFRDKEGYGWRLTKKPKTARIVFNRYFIKSDERCARINYSSFSVFSWEPETLYFECEAYSKGDIIKSIKVEITD